MDKPTTVRDEVIARYFDMVQNEIKNLAINDPQVPQDKVQQLNDEIVTMGDFDAKLQHYIDDAANNDLDLKMVAKELYDELGSKVKNNMFNQNPVGDVPNPMMGERNHIKTFENFSQDVKPKWSVDDFKKLLYQLKGKVDIAKNYLYDEPKDYNELVSSLQEEGSEEADELAEEIHDLLVGIQLFSEERATELSRLN